MPMQTPRMIAIQNQSKFKFKINPSSNSNRIGFFPTPFPSLPIPLPISGQIKNQSKSKPPIATNNQFLHISNLNQSILLLGPFLAQCHQARRLPLYNRTDRPIHHNPRPSAPAGSACCSPPPWRHLIIFTTASSTILP